MHRPPGLVTPSTESIVTVYWRPGCPFCVRLRHGLARAGITTTDVNIWDDPSAAAFVRSVANGNETVPTVTVGTTSFVNPSVRQVMAAVGITQVTGPSTSALARVRRALKRALS